MGEECKNYTATMCLWPKVCRCWKGMVIMKRKYVVMLLAVGMLALTACGKEEDTVANGGCTCTCEACQNCIYKAEDEAKVTVENAEDVFVQASPEASEMTSQEAQSTEAAVTEETQNAQGSIREQIQEQLKGQTEKSVAELTEGEKEARRQLQINLISAREQAYAMENSLEKTQKINEIDKQILENNAFDFSTKSIQFLGDSITEGITASKDEEGNYISYVNYANDYLKFGNCMNNGKAGRMFSDYAGPELSFSLEMGNMFNNSADVAVVFLGVNDYLTARENKRYGDYYATESTAGYVGSVRYALRQLKESYSNQEVFFVTMYDITKTADSTYTDVTGTKELKDYQDVLRTLVKEYGFHLIELQDVGFMDCTDTATSYRYTADGLHPSDEGYRVLGEHIAAELSIYYTQNK